MSIKLLRLWAWALLQIGLSGAVAASEIAAGGLVSYGPIAVSLVRQDLLISPDLVRVTYILHSDSLQEAPLAFPMPPVPIQGGPDFLGGAEINEADPRNYMHFTVAVNGQAVQPKLIESAYLGEADVSDALRNAGLPLLPSPDSASDLIAALPAEQFFSLEESRIVSRGGDDPPHFSPLWSYQASFAWQQSFPPGETKIEISYRPFIAVVENPAEFLRSAAMAAKYCFGDDIAKATSDLTDVVTLSYLLAITPFWKGAIGEFNLKLDGSAEGGFTTYCSPVEGSEASARDFTPVRHLDVAFIYSTKAAP